MSRETVQESRATARRVLRDQMLHAIQEAARSQLAEGEPISFRGVAKAVGCTPPALYRYFGSVDALRLEIAREVLAEYRLDVEAALSSPSIGDGQGQLAAAWLTLRHWMTQDPMRVALLLSFVDTAEGLLAPMDHHVEWLAGKAVSS